MSVSVWQDYKLLNHTADREYDIVIIGAGMAGLSTAYWIKKEHQDLSIAVVDKGEVGSGASGRNAGFVTCGSVEHFNRLVAKHGKDSALSIWKFSETNLELLKAEIIQDNANALEFEQNGSFSLASTEEEFSELKKSYHLMQEMGIKVEILQAKDIVARLGAQGFVGGIKYLGDASINPMKLMLKIKEKLSSDPNFHLLENHEVFAIENHGESKLVKTKKGYLNTSVVVMATNAYSAQLHPYFKDKIIPTRGQILTTSALEPFMEGPCYANFVLDYFRQLSNGQVIIGGFRQLQKYVEVGYSDETTDIIQTSLESFLRQHLPSVKQAEITHRWSGVMGFSVDGQPMIGSLPTDNQLYFIGGFTGHGLGLTFHCGKCLADLLFDREIPEFISAKRF